MERLGVRGLDDGNQPDRRRRGGHERRPVDGIDACPETGVRRYDRIVERRQRETRVLGGPHLLGQRSPAERLARRVVRAAPRRRMAPLAVQLDTEREDAHRLTSFRFDCETRGLLANRSRSTGATSDWNNSRLRRFWPTVTPSVSALRWITS